MSDRAERRLAAILAGDVAGYSRLMGVNEERTVAALRSHRKEVIDPKLAQHRGRLVNTAGDSVLVEFPSVLDAVRCAVEVQQAMAARNAAVPEDQRIVFRIGINIGDVIFQDGEVYGDGVNIAARLEQIGDPGGIFISGVVRNQVGDKLPYGFDDLGPREVKNIAQPVEVWRVHFEGAPGRGTPNLPKAALKSAPRTRWTWIAAAVALAIVVVGGVGWKLWQARSTLFSSDKPGIAVLPFNNLSDDKTQDYFSDGITEDIVTELAHFSQLRVIAHDSTSRYKGKPLDLAQVRAELGVRYVLEGSVRRAGDQVRITSQLIDAETGDHIWAERYDRPLHEIFAIQDELIRKITPLIVGNVLREDLQRAALKPTSNLTAYDLSLLGRKYLQSFSASALYQGGEAFEKAITADPAFADAYVGLAQVYTTAFYQRAGPITGSAALEKAAYLANQAISLNPRSAEAWAQLGYVEVTQRRYDEGIAALEKARTLNANSTFVQSAHASAYQYVGRFDDALREFDDLLLRDPFPLPLFHLRRCIAYFMVRRYDPALSECGRALDRAPNMRPAFRARAAIYAELSDLPKAKAAISEMLRLSPASTVAMEMESLPFKSRVDQDRWVNALRKAGLSE